MSDLLDTARKALPGIPLRKGLRGGNFVRTNGAAAPRVHIYPMNDMPDWLCVDVDDQHFDPVQGEEAAAKVARDAITARRDALDAALGDGWVPVGVRLPDLLRNVPLWTDRGLMFGARGGEDGDGNDWLWADQYGDQEAFADVTVTHWLDVQPPASP